MVTASSAVNCALQSVIMQKASNLFVVCCLARFCSRNGGPVAVLCSSFYSVLASVQYIQTRQNEIVVINTCKHL
jgi:hypothetical protein